MMAFAVHGQTTDQEERADLIASCEECGKVLSKEGYLGIRTHVDYHLDGPLRYIRRMALIGYA